MARGGLVRWGRAARARAWIAEYGVRPGRARAIRTLSGGNVQRAVLARELAPDVGEAELLLVSNPVFGSTSRPWPRSTAA